MTNSSTEKLARELSFQFKLTRAMLGTLELDQILYIILSGITHGDGLNFNRAFLFLSDEGGREIRSSTAVGPFDKEEAHRIWEDMEAQELNLERILEVFEASTDDPTARKLSSRMAGFVVPLTATSPPISEGDQDVPVQALVARCAQQKEPYFSNTLKAIYPPLDDTAGEPLEFTNLAVVPLLLRDTVVGVILADNRYNERKIEQDELRGLTTLSNLAAIAIEKARLHNKLKAMAAVDGLTGVYNRRHYEMRLGQEVAQAQRAGRGLSLLLFDIDNFKQCNDSFGHEVGDKVLKELALVLREKVRAEDLVARYGGEEFVILLTGGATAQESQKVAEKLRSEIESLPLGGQKAGDITISGGVAHLSADVLDGAQLFRRADKALYQAKNDGRNKIVMAQE